MSQSNPACEEGKPPSIFQTHFLVLLLVVVPVHHHQQNGHFDRDKYFWTENIYIYYHSNDTKTMASTPDPKSIAQQFLKTYYPMLDSPKRVGMANLYVRRGVEGGTAATRGLFCSRTFDARSVL